MKKAMMKAVLVALLGFGSLTEGSCKDLNKVLVEISHLFNCECLCQCVEGYRGGGDGMDGGGVQFRCVSKGGFNSCGDACTFQSVGVLGGGNLLACLSV